ncbi:MAG: proteasome subunit alpha [Candidatus Tectimicrobiota bacterium]|nr:MAG: proteasome subunit alpha [Candidatus Tectomicrobia bacterium]
MAMPFYVSPDQWMQDKAEYARKGIAKGKSIVALEYADGVLLTAENPSTSLNKISEIYDHIAFAGVGKYSEFENLRKAGIRYADVKGYAYSRQDVTTKSLANAYSEAIGTIFTRDPKPLEVEILLVSVGETPAETEMYHISFDGSITDHRQYAVIGGQAERIRAYLQEHYAPNLPLPAALFLSRRSLLAGYDRPPAEESPLEVGVLERQRPGRKFRRLSAAEIAQALATGAAQG